MNKIKEIKVLVLTHGKFGEELVNSAEMIGGKLPNVNAFSLMPDMSLEEYAASIENKLKDKEKYLCLIDLFGGTPFNTAAMLRKKYDITIVTGINLNMLLEVGINLNNMDVEALANLACNSLKESGKIIS
ncbi:PTS sugar transporter subunit IIA [Paratissierella segnis]|uniref:PTS sugar transporter subunit IIA n=1 Tax=Paratissierella segnis TaxID=2763679 RepID=A0A926IJC2_9FIRM|nr:PTS sugar transporter subunit IIA [Paratissierella segnis]MBC8587085.1 PTS sugar transporter subunit IIA [Paratissierella segnis]